MSMVINLVEDHNIYLCEGGPVYNGGVQPTPITYLTQWKIVGNSEVHTDPYLTSWKVSGNSVVDNNTILSCGDLGQDGKYHVKISNGVDIYDIALNEPLRKVNDVVDTIEFPSGTEGKALVTRNLKSVVDMSTLSWVFSNFTKRMYAAVSDAKTNPDSSIENLLCPIYPTVSKEDTRHGIFGIAVQSSPLAICVYDENYITSDSVSDFLSHVQGISLIYQLATPITELVDAPQIAVSPTDTYTSANVTPYSAFEHTENKEIWSCGEYNATDRKYHIFVQPQGGSIADIALAEPLRKVNDVADTIEFPSGTEGKALVTRHFNQVNAIELKWTYSAYSESYLNFNNKILKVTDILYVPNLIVTGFDTVGYNDIKASDFHATTRTSNNETYIFLHSNTFTNKTEFENYIQDKIIIYELATPTTELVDAPQIQEADSYSMVISQGGKAVSWSSFETNSE